MSHPIGKLLNSLIPMFEYHMGCTTSGLQIEKKRLSRYHKNLRKRHVRKSTQSLLKFVKCTGAIDKAQFVQIVQRYAKMMRLWFPKLVEATVARAIEDIYEKFPDIPGITRDAMDGLWLVVIAGTMAAVEIFFDEELLEARCEDAWNTMDVKNRGKISLKAFISNISDLIFFLISRESLLQLLRETVADKLFVFARRLEFDERPQSPKLVERLADALSSA